MLIGKNDIQDALKRLDRLTQEEALMAAAQLLRVTNVIDNGVREVSDNVLVVDNRVAGVDGRVKAVDDKIAVVNDGAHYIFYRLIVCLTHNSVKCKNGHGSYATSSRRRRSSETFVISEPH